MAKSKKEVMQPVVTSFEDLKKYSEGTIIVLPPFGPGMPFVARVRRPSMMVLASQKKIPNTLLSTANKLFATGSSAMDPDDDEMMTNLLDLMDILAEATLIEPTLKEIKDTGLYLSDDQYLAIFRYTQEGVQQMEPFREEPRDTELAGDVENIQ